MFSLGGTEILIVVVVALLLFGPDKIPQMARTIGRFMREFNKYKDIMESTVRAEIYRDEWAKDADKPDPKSSSERISQAAGAVQDLVAESNAKGAAAQSAGAVGEGAEAAQEIGPAHVAEHAPALATDEDEEDEV